MDHIIIKPIGVIHSPYQQTKDMPIQGIFKKQEKAWVELLPQYGPALKDLARDSLC